MKRRLESFRLYRRETYDELLQRLMEDAKIGDEEGEYTEETKQRLKRGLSDIREGRTVPLEAVLGKHGISAK